MERADEDDLVARPEDVVLSEHDSSHAMFWCFVFHSCFVYLAQCLPIYTLWLSPNSPALGLVVLVQQVMSPALSLRSRPDRWQQLGRHLRSACAACPHDHHVHPDCLTAAWTLSPFACRRALLSELSTSLNCCWGNTWPELSILVNCCWGNARPKLHLVKLLLGCMGST